MNIVELKKKPQAIVLIYSANRNKPTVYPAIFNSTIELYRFRLDWLNKRNSSNSNLEVSGLLGVFQINLDPLESDHIFNEILGSDVLNCFMSPDKCLEVMRELVTSLGFKITRELRFC